MDDKLQPQEPRDENQDSERLDVRVTGAFKDQPVDDRPDQTSSSSDAKSDPSFQAYTGAEEEYVNAEGTPVSLDTPAEQPAVAAPASTKNKSGAGKWLLVGLAILLVAGLGALAFWQWSEAQSAKQELASVQSQLEASQKTVAPAQEESNSGVARPEKEDFNALSEEYRKLVANEAPLTDADKKAIETAIKDYYKLKEMPAGWQILIAYKDAKADETTGKAVGALVYWPASEQKPSGIFEVSSLADGKWAYNESR